MHDNDNSIHQFDFSLICEYFSSLHRQGPGSEAATRRALSFLPPLAEGATIADVGCGTGASTMVLAQSTAAHIIAVDLFGDFLRRLRTTAAELGVAERITTVEADMAALPMPPDSLEVLWAEGSIYNVGFERGINLWRPLLKNGGYLVVSEATWFTPERPREIDRFWQEAYSEIDLISAKTAQLERAGYRIMATFSLGENEWQHEFYEPAIEAQRQFLERHAGNPTAEALVENQRHEAQVYDRYHQYYGYTFFIAQKR